MTGPPPGPWAARGKGVKLGTAQKNPHNLKAKRMTTKGIERTD